MRAVLYTLSANVNHNGFDLTSRETWGSEDESGNNFIVETDGSVYPMNAPVVRGTACYYLTTAEADVRGIMVTSFANYCREQISLYNGILGILEREG